MIDKTKNDWPIAFDANDARATFRHAVTARVAFLTDLTHDLAAHHVRLQRELVDRAIAHSAGHIATADAVIAAQVRNGEAVLSELH